MSLIENDQHSLTPDGQQRCFYCGTAVESAPVPVLGYAGYAGIVGGIGPWQMRQTVIYLHPSCGDRLATEMRTDSDLALPSPRQS